MLNGYHQVMGHTQVDEIKVIEYTNRSGTYINVLHKENRFLELDLY